jgi:ABC-type uncharacterized transport system ATPase subunit
MTHLYATEQPYTQYLHLSNFTVFKDATFNFVPGINAFIGENGAGKTHLMKALYAFQYARAREVHSLDEVLQELFQTKNAADVISLDASPGETATVSGSYSNIPWSYAIQKTSGAATVVSTNPARVDRPVFTGVGHDGPYPRFHRSVCGYPAGLRPNLQRHRKPAEARK